MSDLKETTSDHSIMNVHLKDDGSYVTNADFTAQGIIVQALRQVSGQIRIVGEESPEEMARHIHNNVFLSEERLNLLAQEEMRMRYWGQRRSTSSAASLPLAETAPDSSSSSLSSSSLPTTEAVSDRIPIEELEDANLPEHVVDLDRVSVFVDPLDGTKSYAHGNYDAVTVLVAIILDNYPYFGVICKPFGIKGQTSILDTGCVAVYGGKLLDGVFIGGGAQCGRPSWQTASQDLSSLPRAVISSSRSKGVVENFVHHLAAKGIVHPEPFLISGAGEKSLRLILGSENEALWFFPKDGTSRWDVAASDALLRAVGGKLTDKYGQELDYSTSRLDAANVDGIIASNDADLHAECIRLFLEGNWSDESK
jgi:3'-phosphoadenosine 5'-phosphosulfate (PAPS) 3'-phosphatase